MLKPTPSAHFRKDVKRLDKRGKDLKKLASMINLLASGAELPPRYRDHPLKGDWNGFRDAHIEPDWLLIYRILDDELQLARTGSHADLFE